ncbi:ABC transporter ATP-binding protein [Candidatus Korobacter versatilis]|nr:phosphate ABC transporter ATP-binding protein [Candidatus Koribacter versatilis]
MPESILRTEELGYSVGDKVIVDAVSLTVAQGEVLCVLGPSGSGKSSFLRLLNRLAEPTSGMVYLEGKDYRELAPRELRRRVGMITQQAFLFPGRVAENVRFGPRQRGQEITDDAVEECLRGVGLSGYGSRQGSTLSGGEAQRVSIARALANEPVVLLADEPTSALDDFSKSGIEALLREIVKARQLTCVMVTHDVAQARRMADRVALFRGGRVVGLGTLAEVLDEPAS